MPIPKETRAEKRNPFPHKSRTTNIDVINFNKPRIHAITIPSKRVNNRGQFGSRLFLLGPTPRIGSSITQFCPHFTHGCHVWGRYPLKISRLEGIGRWFFQGSQCVNSCSKSPPPPFRFSRSKSPLPLPLPSTTQTEARARPLQKLTGNEEIIPGS